MHRAIETYGIPTEFVRHRQTPTGHPAPKRFHPVFRDRDELPASADLGAVIKDALSAAHYLIVICSPNAARSQWVNTEIETFLALGRRDHILAIIVDGEPNAGDARECFPPALRTFEPIAADARRQGDGKTNAKLKLLAGMLGVDFDALKQRDRQRRKRRRILGGGAAGLLMTVMATLAGIALNQRESAISATINSDRRLYAKNMLEIQNAWDRADLRLFKELLDGQRPEQTGAKDLRGFEWHHWMKQGRSQLLTISGLTEARVFCVPSSPDGKQLASLDEEGVAKVWDTATGKTIFALDHKQNHGGFTGICFSPDGKRIATGYSKGRTPRGLDNRKGTRDTETTVQVWDAANGKELFELHGDCGEITSLCFSPDGKRLAAGSKVEMAPVEEPGTGRQNPHVPQTRIAGSKVLMWKAERGNEPTTLVENDKDGGEINCVCFSPDGQRLAWGGWETVWEADWEDAAAVQKLRPSTTTGLGYADNAPFLSSDGKRWATGGRRIVKMLDAATGKELFAFRGKMRASAESVCFSPDGTQLATADGGTIRVWDVPSGKELYTLGEDRPDGEYASVCFSPDGKQLVGGGTDIDLKVWDAASGKVLYTPRGFGLLSDILKVFFSPDSKRLYTVTEGGVDVWDATNTGPLPNQVEVDALAVSISPDGKRLATFASEGVKVWDAESGEQLQLVAVEGAANVDSAGFSVDGKRLATGNSGGVWVWETSNGRQLLSIKGAGGAKWIHFSPDGQRLATVHYGGGEPKVLVQPDGEEVTHPDTAAPANRDKPVVKVWDAEDGRNLLTLEADWDVCFSPDGQRLATGGSGNAVAVWNALSGRLLLSIRLKRGGSVSSIAFSPDGRRLAAAASGGGIVVWDATSGQELFSNKEDASSVCFSPDGRRIAVAGGGAAAMESAAEIGILDAESGLKLLRLPGHKNGVWGLRFSLDGRRLIACDDDGVKIWGTTDHVKSVGLQQDDPEKDDDEADDMDDQVEE